MTLNITNQAWLLVRSNPNKKDSIHYNREEALRLQSQLARGTVAMPQGERTEIHDLIIDRNVCGVSVVSVDYLVTAEPNHGL